MSSSVQCGWLLRKKSAWPGNCHLCGRCLSRGREDGTHTNHLTVSAGPESPALPALLRIELTRAVTRALPALLPDARDLLLAFSFVAIDDDIVEAAMNEPDRGLRSLDAIHLATARVLGEDLDALVSYDDRLLKAAADAGLITASPRD